MASRRNRVIQMPAPYLRRIWLEPSRIANRAAYPFCLPFLGDEFELSFDRSITIIVGENGTGKSTLLEGIAVLAGYDEAGGGNGHMPVDHSKALETMGGQLSKALRASWLPRITKGWFFRAESFFSVARYQDKVNLEYIPGVPPGTPPDYLSHSHGEGFLRFFEERCQRQGIFIFDEPESALSPARQIEFLKLIRLMDVSELPGHHGHACADADGLSQCTAAAAIEVWARAGDHRTDRSLQGHARILRRSGGVRGSGDRKMITPPPVRPMLAQVSDSEAKAALYYGNR
jgi:predicted ATPase